MEAIYVAEPNPTQPLAALAVGTFPGQLTAPGPEWELVTITATSLNHHDVWSLRGVGLRADFLPMVLGTDGVGKTSDGTQVLIHSVIADYRTYSDETLDPHRSLLSERYPGTFAEQVWVPKRNLIALPPFLSASEGACLPTAYLTAFRLLTTAGGLEPGMRVLIQGATGAVASAALILARGMGAHVSVSSRSEAGRKFAAQHGAHEVIEVGQRIAPVDVVIETVGEATWDHSLKSLKPGGVLAVAGATTGSAPPADLARVFFRSLRIHGSTMGTLAQFHQLIAFLEHSGIRPIIDQSYAAADPQQVQAAFGRMIAGEQRGKLVLTW